MNDAIKPKRPLRISQGRDYWKKHIQQWRASKLSQSAYCRQYQIALETFHNWKAKLTGMPKSLVHSMPVFVPIKVTPAPVVNKIDILINASVALRIDIHTDPDLIRPWIAALRDHA